MFVQRLDIKSVSPPEAVHSTRDANKEVYKPRPERVEVTHTNHTVPSNQLQI